MMDQCATKFTFSWIGFTILLLSVSQCTSWPRAGSIGDLSHFEGLKADSDLICESRLVGKRTPLPAQISFTSQLPITAYSAEASKYNRHGFTISIETGALNTNAIGLLVHGPKTLPYDVLVKLYCTSTSTPIANGNIPALCHAGGMKLASDFFYRILTIPLDTELPLSIGGACSSTLVVSAYTAVAKGRSRKGFTLAVTSGAVGTCDLILTLDVPGATTLPYDVELTIFVRARNGTP